VCLLALVGSPELAHAGFIDLEWDEPTTNLDGSPLTDLLGYRVYVSLSPTLCPGPNFRAIAAPDRSPGPGDVFEAFLTGLTGGATYFVRVTAVDTSGNESPCSPEVSGPARTDLSVAPSGLTFGSVNVGSSATLDLTVQNLGPTTLTGTASTVAPFSVVAGSPLSIPAGQSRIVRVRFAPVAVQTFAGSVSIATSGDDASMALNGSGTTATPAVLQFGQGSYAVTEGGAVTLTVTRTGGMHGGVTVSYATANGSATAGADYTPASDTLTFAANQASRTFTIGTLQDGVAELPETFTVTLSSPGGGTVLGAPSVATVTISDDESNLQFAPAVYSVIEGGVATITVTRTGSATQVATVDWATSDGSATAGSDYVPGSGTLTFPAGVRSRTFTVATLADTAAEPAETVLLTLSNPSAGAIAGPQRTAVLTIKDNDVGGQIYFNPPTHLVPENRGRYNVPVLRVGGAAGNVSVQYVVVGGTATGGGVDYTLASGVLTFGPGQTTAVIPIDIVDDGLPEPNETIVLQLGSPTGGAILRAPTQTTITIVDNDRTATFQFSAPTYSAVEGAGSALITVTRVGSTVTPVNVDVTSDDGTAVAGTDYTAGTTTLTFATGVTSRTVSVPILPTGTVDGTRTVNLALGNLFSINASNTAVIGTPATAVLSILDDDSTLQFSAATHSVSEGGTATITVQRTGSALGTVSVAYAVTGGTATAPADYTAPAGRLTFGPGVMTRTFTVPTKLDALVEGGETVQLALGAPAGNATIGSPGAATLTITDAPPTVKFGAASYTVTEGTPTVTITVLRTGLSTGTVTVDYDVTGGTATSPQDYTVNGTGSLTFGPGVTSRTFTVTIANDTLPEGPQTVSFGLSGAVGAVIGTPSSTTLTIQDNEPQVKFGAAAYTVNEATPSIAITVVRTGPATGTVTASYAVTGTATGGGTDYAIANPGALTFLPGATSQTIRVTITNDALAEGPETVVFTLTGATNATIGPPSSTTLTIVDDEPQVRFASASYTASEATPSLQITVLRSGTTTGTVTVDYAATGGTASPQDYVLGGAVSGVGTLTFGPGVTAQSFTLGLANDTLAEGAETIVLTLSDPTGATLGAPAASTVNLSSNDVAGVIQFSSPIYSRDEGGGEATITVLRQGGLASGVTVHVATVDDTAVAGTDYTAISRTVTFDAGQSAATFTVPLIDNGTAEGGRSLGLVLSAPGGGAALGPQRTAVLWITDDD
jgi:hypothetical protein